MGNNDSSILPGEPIRVLVADNSVVSRRLVARIFEKDRSIHVVGFACDASETLNRIKDLKPHMVTLEMELPGMAGLGVLRRIVEQHPGVQVILLNALAEQSSQLSAQALKMGASDCLTKPAANTDEAYEPLGKELLLKVRGLFQKAAASPENGSQTPAATAPKPLVRPAAEICAIGLSTGGPDALMEALPMIPSNFPLPIVIVQHMPPVFTEMLAKRLALVCCVPVIEGVHGMVLKPGRIVIAPGDFHMRVARVGQELVVRLDQGPKENSCRPAVDVLFRSIAEAMNGKAIAVVLTGMGQDGLAGARLLKAKGATILTQDQASSVVWGMPGAIAGANLSDAVLPLGRIVPEILQRIQS